jgi:hypothetical protein
VNDELTERLERPQKELRAEPSLLQLIDANEAHTREARELMARADGQPITFKEFRMLMEQRNQGVDDLADRFRGKIDDPREFFERVMSCRVKVAGHFEDRSDCVIPYRSVIEFYREELHFFKDVAKSNQRYCACGCGTPVFGQFKFARAGCRKRVQRQKAATDMRLSPSR